ncbi:protein ACCELERATED CELL DEATH [Salix suchowensis]|nr:protein ACCELERATED CELL DEATH [Salix suchowensis]
MRKANTKGNTPLHDAVIVGNSKLAIFLASKDPEVAYSSNKNGRSPLYLAVENGNMERILDDLLKSEASITIPKGKSTFLAAIKQRKKGDLNIIDKIWGRRDDQLNIVPCGMPAMRFSASPIGESPVHAALEQRNKAILEDNEKAKPELLRLTDEELGNTLHYASSIGKSPVHAAIKQRLYFLKRLSPALITFKAIFNLIVVATL